jgi:hypothetical protein
MWNYISCKKNENLVFWRYHLKYHLKVSTEMIFLFFLKTWFTEKCVVQKEQKHFLKQWLVFIFSILGTWVTRRWTTSTTCLRSAAWSRSPPTSGVPSSRFRACTPPYHHFSDRYSTITTDYITIRTRCILNKYSYQIRDGGGGGGFKLDTVIKGQKRSPSQISIRRRTRPDDLKNLIRILTNIARIRNSVCCC